MRQLVILAILAGLMHLSSRTGLSVGHAPYDTQTLIATGFILLAAYACGELFRRFRLPAILGYLTAGVLCGPSFAGLMYEHLQPAPLSRPVLHELGLVNMLAVGVIGTMGGCELKVSDFKENLPKIAAMTACVFVLVLPAVTGLVFVLTDFAPQFVPFLAALPFEGRLAGALLFGVLAVGMSPSATLALLQEVHARGRVTSLVLGTVVFADLVLVAMFLLTLALSKLLISPEGFTFQALAEALPQIATEFGWAIVIGLAVGVVFIAYLRLVKREILLFSLGVVFVTSFVASRLHAETLLAFLVGGFVVQNFSRHGDDLNHAFEHIALPVFVIYFATQAASLDLLALGTFLPLALMLVGTRCSLYYVGIGMGARIAKVEDAIRRPLQVSFFSQGGVDLVLAAMIAEAIPAWGPEVQTVTMATILFYALGGPPFLARALDTVGESAATRERGASNLLEEEVVRRPTERVATFAVPAERPDRLGKRLNYLYTQITELARTLVEEGVVDRGGRRADVVEALMGSISRTLATPGMVEGVTLDPSEHARRLAMLDDAVVAASRRWSDPDYVPFDAGWIVRFFQTLTEAEPMAASTHVVCEPALFERQGRGWQRLVRLARRTRRALIGPGMRTVPTGRLWRYHVAFDVPVTLWSNLQCREAKWWHFVLEHYRVTRRDLASFGAGGDHEGTLVERMHAASVRASERETVLVERMRAEDEQVARELVAALADAWQSFLASVALAGTLERPSWRYRVSRKYDTAQAAKADLRERVDREQQRAAGRRDALLAMAHGSRLSHWVRATAERITDDLGTNIDSIIDRVDVAIEQSVEVDAGLARTIEEILALLEQCARAHGSRPSVDANLDRAHVMEREIPALLSPEVDLTRPPELQREARRISVALRPWLTQTILSEFAVASVAFADAVEQHLSRISMSLHHAQEVLSYHVGSAGVTVLSRDEGLGERLVTLLQKSRQELDGLVRDWREPLRERVESAAANGVTPLLEGQWEDVRRGLRRLDDRGRVRVDAVQWVRDVGDNALTGTRRFARRVADEVAVLFDERSTPAEAEAFRTLILGPAAKMPDAYQRLFTSVPAERVGLIVERPEAALLRAATEQWLEGRSGAVLLRGDPGAGKRTLVRQMIAERGDQLWAHFIRLEAGDAHEERIAAVVAAAAGWPHATRFEPLATAARHSAVFTPGPRSPVIVIENTERLFRRTPAGLETMRAFLDLVTASAGDLLWIVVIAEPALRVLNPVLEVEAHFASVVSVGSVDLPMIRRVLEARHRLSGYSLRVDTHAPTVQTWLRNPAQAWRAFRGRHGVVYERVWMLSHGNIRQGLRLWLALVEPDPSDPAAAIVGQIAAMPSPLLEDVPLSGRLLLASLLLHGPLTHRELELEQPADAPRLTAQIARLQRRGLVWTGEVRSRGHGLEPIVGIAARAAVPLLEELRQCNLL